MSDAAIRNRFIVSGRVQGVGFRAWTVRRAERLELRGTVRNLADGTVEIEVEGTPPAVRRMRELLSRGPDSARVRLVRDEPPTDGSLPPRFTVIY